MSRWLANMNTLLEKLDGTVEEAIEEQRDEDVNNLDSILAKRGLAEDFVEAELPNIEHIKIDHDSTQERKDDGQEKQPVSEVKDIQEISFPDDKEKESHSEPNPIVELESEYVEEDAVDEASVEPKIIVKGVSTNNFARDDRTLPKGENNFVSEEGYKDRDVTSMISTFEEKNDGKLKTPVETTETPPTSLNYTHQTALTTGSKISEEAYKQGLNDERKSQREARTLRRQFVSLNNELESAELELEAQRVELSQAGDRLETNRKKAKDEKEKQTKLHDSQIKTLNQEKEKLVSEIKARHQKQLEELQHKVRESDEKRMQEGGDWTKELENTIEREHELIKKLAFVEDEKSTLLSQISTLQSQDDRLQSRMDSISQTADNAMIREREAEDKLDMALSMHARQLSQRQAREADLECTISELSAFLASSTPPTLYDNAEGDTAAGASNNLQLKTQVYSLEEELESLKSQLGSEKQRVIIMQQELRDMSKERTLEATFARSKQHQFDRQIAEMSLQISKLESNLREAHKSGGSVGKSGISDGNSRQLTELTEQVVRHQENMGRAKSEISALRNRLQVAVTRAENAEEALERLEANNEGDIESGSYGAPVSGNGGMRRRRKRNEVSIRSAINLSSTSARNQNTERLGKAIDTLDNFSVQTGKYLRYNPLARGSFILYLIMLHTWTFVVLFLHTHKFETIHGDFGAGHHLAHGPHALMQQTRPEISKIVAVDSEVTKLDIKDGGNIVQEKPKEKGTLDEVTFVGKEKNAPDPKLIDNSRSELKNEQANKQENLEGKSE